MFVLRLILRFFPVAINYICNNTFNHLVEERRAQKTVVMGDDILVDLCYSHFSMPLVSRPL